MDNDVTKWTFVDQKNNHKNSRYKIKIKYWRQYSFEKYLLIWEKNCLIYNNWLTQKYNVNGSYNLFFSCLVSIYLFQSQYYS